MKSCKSRWKNVFLQSKIALQNGIKKNIRDFEEIIKFGDYNIGRNGDLLTLPTYMQFLLDLEPEDIMLEAIDADELTRLARGILDSK